MKPIGTRYRHAAFTSTRFPSHVIEKPIIRQAVRLITSVPYGNRLPIRPATVEPTQYRAIEPSAPPRAINRYFCKRASPSQPRSARNWVFLGLDCETGKNTEPCYSTDPLHLCAGILPGHDIPTGIPVRSHHLSVSDSGSRRIARRRVELHHR